MQRDMKLLQTNYCCISDDEMIYVTEQNKVFVKMNLLTKAAKIMNKDILQNRVEYICTYQKRIYLVDMAQKWVAEADIDDSSRKIKYYHLKWHGGEVENFSFICRYNEKIYMFFRNEAIVIIFNMITKKAVEKNIGIGQDNIKIDCGCIWEDKVYLFSSQMKQYFRYNLTNEDKDYMGNIPFAGEVLYAICNNEYMYVLSQNTVYDVKDNFRLIVKVDDPINCNKICFAKDKIWFLPGLSDKIYTYCFKTNTYAEYQDYPEDYGYDIPEGWSKFVGYTENKEYIYWCMRANNYIFQLNKCTGEEKWIRPVIQNVQGIINKSYFEESKVNYEGICRLDDYINYLKSME